LKKKADADRYSVEQAAAAAKAKQLAEADAEQYSIFLFPPIQSAFAAQ
jgi:flotillin